MANTYVLINSQTLSTTASSVTFSSIPQTYTDLLLRMSAKSNSSTFAESPKVIINSITSNYNHLNIFRNASNGVINTSNTNAGTYFTMGAGAIGNAATVPNVFGNGEIYLPNYTNAQDKPMIFQGVQTTAITTVGGVVQYGGGRVTTTEAITSLTLSLTNGSLWLENSSFWLYGIKKS